MKAKWFVRNASKTFIEIFLISIAVDLLFSSVGSVISGEMFSLTAVVLESTLFTAISVILGMGIIRFDSRTLTNSRKADVERYLIENNYIEERKGSNSFWTVGGMKGFAPDVLICRDESDYIIYSTANMCNDIDELCFSAE